MLSRLPIVAFVCLQLLTPVLVWAQATAPKSPLDYSLRLYGAVLGTAMLGGFVRWFYAVKKGEAAMYDIRILIGELFTSAFIGILTFWACEALRMDLLYTAALCGLTGHMGISLLVWAERVLKKRVEKHFGVDPTTHPAPLDRH